MTIPLFSEMRIPFFLISTLKITTRIDDINLLFPTNKMNLLYCIACIAIFLTSVHGVFRVAKTGEIR